MTALFIYISVYARALLFSGKPAFAKDVLVEEET